MLRTASPLFVIAALLHGCAPLSSTIGGQTDIGRGGVSPAQLRASAIQRAQVWMPTDVATMDIMAGPGGPHQQTFRATIRCTYLAKALSGHSPKFACDDGESGELKVKYGGGNAEVYAEVAATRLLWALGFGADRMYPVRVICQGCPQALGGTARDDGTSVFDPAAIEHKMSGHEFPGNSGWSWEELDRVDESAGGAPRAQRDALKLVAVLLQHTDTKPAQQRLMCLDPAPAEDAKDKELRCEQPFMMINDLGLTFGRANMFNPNHLAMNLVAWSSTPIWKEGKGCVGNLAKSLTGTLRDPVISEEGRQFLADLLMQLTDQQIHDLFEVARVQLRLRNPVKALSGTSTIEEWANAFKMKRAEIVEKRCDAA